MKQNIRHIALLFVLLMGVLSLGFAHAGVHDTSKMGFEKSAVDAESIKACKHLKMNILQPQT